MKTALEAGGLAVRRFATRLLGLYPQRLANGFGSGRVIPTHRCERNLNAAIDYCPLGPSRRTISSRFFRSRHHEVKYGALGVPTQAR